MAKDQKEKQPDTSFAGKHSDCCPDGACKCCCCCC